MSVKLHEKFQRVIEDADLAGMKAVEAMTPVGMMVYTPKNPVASLVGGDDGGPDPNEPTYYVADGVCGFAWVNVKGKDTEGRKFLNWLKGSVKSARPYSAVHPADACSEPRADSYYGGVSVWVSGFAQSMQKKEAYGQAFAAKLNASIDGLAAYCMSRMD